MANSGKPLTNVTSINDVAISGCTTLSGTNPTYTFGPYQPSYTPIQSQPAPAYPPYIPDTPKVPGLDELCEILEVKESPNPDTMSAFTVMGESGKVYSLVDLISAQVEIMARLHLLLVHRNITME